jgi:hypothetical protein
MEKNKLTLILFLLVGIMFGQTTKVGGVTFSYDKKTDTMKLLVPKDLFTSEDKDWQKQIRISKDYELSMTINGQEVTMSETFYYSCGREYHTGSEGTYYFPNCGKCVYHSITTESFSLKYPPKGEYVISVSDICDEKWVTNKHTGSIIIK